MSRAGHDGAPQAGAAQMDCVARPARLAALRARIAALEAAGGRSVAARARLSPRAAAPSGAADALAAFRGRAGLHDIRPESYFDAPAAYAFAVRWLAGLPDDRLVVWVRGAGDPRLDFGAPCPDGLAACGLDPARLLLVRARAGADALWAMEEALNAGALVFGEAGAQRAYDLTASRRLQARAAASGSCVLALASHDANATSAGLTRWRIAAAPGPAPPGGGGGGGGGRGAKGGGGGGGRPRGGP
ncbi:MAG: hypothetical protein LAT81_06955, partial [Oceanicaulis sp.]|nr:hypothetical protein [Oceanicaulis sp.]